jgi:hypothetical protein
MTRSLSRRLGTLALVGLLGLAACDDNGSPTDPPPDPTPAAVEITPEEALLEEIGETIALEATVFDEDDEIIADAEVTWSSDDEDVATVDEEGVVEAVGVGTATITAESGQASGSAELTVEAEG